MDGIELQSLSDINIKKVYFTVLDILSKMVLVKPDSVITLEPVFEFGDSEIRKGRSCPKHRQEAIEILDRLNVLNRPNWDIRDAEIYHRYSMKPDIGKLNAIKKELEEIWASRNLAQPSGPQMSSKPRSYAWGEVSIKFLSEKELSISVGDSPAKRCALSELGLTHKKNSDHETKLCETLRIFAVCNGTINKQLRFEKDLKKNVQRLGKKLIAYFKINSSPFYPYSKKDGEYRTRFAISHENISFPQTQYLFKNIPHQPGSHRRLGPDSEDALE